MNRRDALAGLLALGITGQPQGVFAQAVAASKKQVSFLCLFPALERTLRDVPALLAKLGWIEGKNVSYQWRNAQGKPEALSALAAEALALSPDVIVADGNLAVHAALRVTHTIPIVVFGSIDPVGAGLARSLARPGGTVTGLTWGEPRLAAKIVDILHQAVPRTRSVAVLYDPSVPGIQLYVEADRDAANAIGMEFSEYPVRNAGDLVAALESLRKDKIESIKAALGGHFGVEELRQVLDYSSRYRVPTVSTLPAAVQRGALLGYYPNDSERVNRISAQLDKILRGSKPGEMPFEYPARFDLDINLRTAKALGITIPQSVLLSANSLIE